MGTVNRTDHSRKSSYGIETSLYINLFVTGWPFDEVGGYVNKRL